MSDSLFARRSGCSVCLSSCLQACIGKGGGEKTDRPSFSLFVRFLQVARRRSICLSLFLSVPLCMLALTPLLCFRGLLCVLVRRGRLQEESRG